MKKKYETPELTLVGEAEDIVMGTGSLGTDMPHLTGPDFEFEQD